MPTPHLLLTSTGTGLLLDGAKARIAGMSAGDDACGCCPTSTVCDCTGWAGTYTFTGTATYSYYSSTDGTCTGSVTSISLDCTGANAQTLQRQIGGPCTRDNAVYDEGSMMYVYAPVPGHAGWFYLVSLELDTTTCKNVIVISFTTDMAFAYSDGTSQAGNGDAHTVLPSADTYPNVNTGCQANGTAPFAGAPVADWKIVANGLGIGP